MISFDFWRRWPYGSAGRGRLQSKPATSLRLRRGAERGSRRSFFKSRCPFRMPIPWRHFIRFLMSRDLFGSSGNDKFRKYDPIVIFVLFRCHFTECFLSMWMNGGSWFNKRRKKMTPESYLFCFWCASETFWRVLELVVPRCTTP